MDLRLLQDALDFGNVAIEFTTKRLCDLCGVLNFGLKDSTGFVAPSSPPFEHGIDAMLVLNAIGYRDPILSCAGPGSCSGSEVLGWLDHRVGIHGVCVYSLFTVEVVESHSERIESLLERQSELV
jgi:hypothetical protein